MYVLPKGLESAWLTARGRGWVGRTGRWGEVLVCASDFRRLAAVSFSPHIAADFGGYGYGDGMCYFCHSSFEWISDCWMTPL